MSDYFWWDTYTDLKRDLGREPLDDEVEDEYNRRYGWSVKMETTKKKEIVNSIADEIESRGEVRFYLFIAAFVIFAILNKYLNLGLIS